MPRDSLTRKRPPGGDYAVNLPRSWLFHDASIPSDHSTHLWQDPKNPFRKMEVVLSRCVGCAAKLPDMNLPDPSAVVPAGASPFPIDEWSVGFQTYSNDNPYPDDGRVYVLHDNSDHPSGYVQVDLWLPVSQAEVASAILMSFAPTEPTQ